MTREGGKPRIENADEVGWVAAAFDYYAELGRNFAGRVIPPIEASQLALVLKEPMGVVACIVPWNYPLLLLAWKLAPALAAGNACVCKPSELTPLSTLALADCLEVLPPGVVNLVPGGGDVGARIVADERVDCVAFTGSVETGKRIAHTCVDRVARINLELGGKDPFIVCADVAAEIEIAARGGALGRVPQRRPGLHVGRALLRRRTRSTTTSSPPSSTTRARCASATRSPRAPTSARWSARPSAAKVERQLEAAVGAGAEVVFGGDHAGHARGLVHGADGRHRRARGDRPAARGDVRAGRPDRARALARRGDRARQRHALRARRQRLHARPASTIFRCMRELKAGTVWFNDPLTDNDAGPFGGFKQSGLGRELGQEGLEAFQETKHVHIESELERKDWWYPYG